MARVVPRFVRFVSEFGAQSVPDSAESFVDVAAWPRLDWEALREHHGLEVDVMAARVPPTDHPTFGSWRTATQRNQAVVLRHHIETLRRLKYRPTGGFSFSWLADPGPMISASVLDHERRPKLAWQSVVDACRPIVVITDPLPAVLSPGQDIRLDVHVVNDLRVAVVDATVAVTCTWRGGRRDWAFGGDVEADSCVLVGRLELTVPDRPGELLLGLALTGRGADDGEVTATRRAGAAHRRALTAQVRRELAAVLDLGGAVVGVHQRDHVEGDRLRARRLALAVVGARAEVLLHRLDHRLGAGEAFGLALRQQVEVGDLGRREQLGGPVRARRHARPAADAQGGGLGGVGDRLGDRDEVGVGRPAGGAVTKPPASTMRSKAPRSVIRSLMMGKALARHGSTTISAPSSNMRMCSWHVAVPRCGP